MFLKNIELSNIKWRKILDTEKMVLGLLMSGPKTGYRMKNITGKLVMAYNLSLNQVYPILRKLEASELIKKEVVFQIGKPNKHEYTITEMGKETFLKSITGPPMPVDYKFDFLTRLFFFRFLKGNEIIGQFENEISSLDEQLEDLRLINESAKDKSDENGKFIYETIVGMFEMLRKRYSAELARRNRKLSEE